MCGLTESVPIGSRADRYSSLARSSYSSFSSCSAASRSFCFTSASETTTNVHGCWFAPDGAEAAVRIAFSISSRSTGSVEKFAHRAALAHQLEELARAAPRLLGVEAGELEGKRLVARLGLQEGNATRP